MNDFTGLFSRGAELFEAELYWEAIDCFKVLTELHPKEPLLDDVYLNLAVCYMKLNLFHEAKEFFLPVYKEEIGDGFFEAGGNNFGSTRARATLGLIRINIALNDIEQAETLLEELRNSESGIAKGNQMITFYELGLQEINFFKNQ